MLVDIHYGAPTKVGDSHFVFARPLSRIRIRVLVHSLDGTERTYALRAGAPFMIGAERFRVYEVDTTRQPGVPLARIVTD